VRFSTQRITPADLAVRACPRRSGHRRSEQGGRSPTRRSWDATAELAQLHPFAAIVPVSAEKAQLAALRGEIAKVPLSERLYPEDDLGPRRRFSRPGPFGEIFSCASDEVPYATTVGIDKFEMDGTTHTRRSIGQTRSAQSCWARVGRR
jgi:GTPase Era involved in 16S rRNA processing